MFKKYKAGRGYRQVSRYSQFKYRRSTRRMNRYMRRYNKKRRW